MSKRVVFSVTNDLNHDQRMERICTSLANAGYRVTLVGVLHRSSQSLRDKPFRQQRLRVFFPSGKLFYFEYNLRLFFWLLFQPADLFCAIDLDTIMPNFWVSFLRRKQRVYDAHELFCEMKEVVSRPLIHKCWSAIESWYLPRFKYGYTVNQVIAEIFNKKYGVNYRVVRNLPVLIEEAFSIEKDNYLLYQGAVNEGRAFEVLIPAMQWINTPLWICGDGNFMEQTRELVRKYGVEDKVVFKGRVLPEDLRKITMRAKLGFTLFENKGLNNYYSLANRFFDYFHAATPQVCVNYPVYAQLNKEAPVAVLLDELSPECLARTVEGLLNDSFQYRQLQENCLRLRQELNWQREQAILLDFYHQMD